MNIAELLRDQAELRPEAIALIDVKRGRSRRFTFAELDRAGSRVAMLLHQSGLEPGDTVLVLHPMSAELYIVLTAIFRLGLVAMFVDPSEGRKHIERSCALQPPQAVIASLKAHFLRLVSPALRRIPEKFSIGLPVPGAVSLQHADRLRHFETIQPCTPDSPALLTFTSGSTGTPKPALRTHGFLLAQHRALEESLQLKPGEVELTTLPMFVLANLASGVTSLIPDADLRRPDAIDPAPVVAQIRAHQVTRAAASPAFYERLVAYCGEHDTRLPNLAKLFTGGGPVSPQLLEELQRIAPQATVTTVYGSTEAEPIARIARHEIATEDIAAMLGGRGLLVGLPVPIIRLRILKNQWGCPVGPYTSAEFDAACKPAGEGGEIVVSGAHVLSGYMNGCGDEENKFNVAGVPWHRTGDAGYLDDRGRLWLLGRCSARIEDSHGTLYPLSVEYAALQYDCVRRAAVASIQGERVLAVELRNGRLPESHLAQLLESLAFADVRKVHVLKRMPVDNRHNSKIDYPALNSLLEKSV
ncbi:MAG: AMP-binding protein [Planctomycetes bacterium]|nr:AMP-binding protein [Planctomycetota bacterium]